MITRSHGPEFACLTRQQIDVIERFEADYNAVDKYLRRELGFSRQESFNYVVSQYSGKHRGWRDADLLRVVSELRNTIVHGKTEPYRYLAIPTPDIAKALNECRSRLLHPTLVVPKFQRNVEQLSTTDTLDDVLRIIARRDYSQFPAYDGTRFIGLLTENGIAQWMAANVDQEIFGLKDIAVSEVLKSEDPRPNHMFVARTSRVDDVIVAFATRAMLEAVLITNSGKVAEKPIGIVTRWDIIRISSDQSKVL